MENKISVETQTGEIEEEEEQANPKADNYLSSELSAVGSLESVNNGSNPLQDFIIQNQIFNLDSVSNSIENSDNGANSRSLSEKQDGPKQEADVNPPLNAQNKIIKVYEPDLDNIKSDPDQPNTKKTQTFNEGE